MVRLQDMRLKWKKKTGKWVVVLNFEQNIYCRPYTF